MRHESEQLPPPRRPAGLAEGRASERHAIRKHAILHCHDRVQTVLIRDISAGGMKIQNAFGLVARRPRQGRAVDAPHPSRARSHGRFRPTAAYGSTRRWARTILS